MTAFRKPSPADKTFASDEAFYHRLSGTCAWGRRGDVVLGRHHLREDRLPTRCRLDGSRTNAKSWGPFLVIVMHTSVVWDAIVTELKRVLKQRQQAPSVSKGPRTAYTQHQLDSFSLIKCLDKVETKTLACRSGEVHIGRTEVCFSSGIKFQFVHSSKKKNNM